MRGFEPQSGAPRGGLPVTLRVSHGTSITTRSLVLDARGRARADIRGLPLGTNLAIVEANESGERALDAAAVTIAPGSLNAAAPPPSDVHIALDRARYKPQDKVSVRARVDGAAGRCVDQRRRRAHLRGARGAGERRKRAGVVTAGRSAR